MIENYSNRMTTRLDISHLDYQEALELIIQDNPDFCNIDTQIDFWADHSQSKILRDYVGKIFEVNGITSSWKGRFILITDELINNAIEHWSSIWDLDSCVIRAGKDINEWFFINIEVHDTGTGKDSEKAKDMIQVRNNHQVSTDEVYMEKRGRWLFYITEKLVDKLSFSESPKWWLAVTIEKNIPKAEHT